jgi:hypothetical protein
MVDSLGDQPLGLGRKPGRRPGFLLLQYLICLSLDHGVRRTPGPSALCGKVRRMPLCQYAD